MGASKSKITPSPIMEKIAAGLIPAATVATGKPIRIFSLDGNIGVGKSTLLKQIADQVPELLIVQEPVDVWTALKNADGQNLLELFYKDKQRYAYTFQNAAILSRLKLLRDAVAAAKPGQIILTERSVLTDRYVFAEMLKGQGFLNGIEWQLYTTWFDTFATDLPMAGIVYITTPSEIAYERIQKRARDGEGSIELSYLVDLAGQHVRWLSQTSLPVLNISTREGIDVRETLAKLGEFLAAK